MYSPEAYIALIKSLRALGYRFADFGELPSKDEQCIFLRHDIDFSPHWAADFAEINEQCGIVGTFCFQVRNPLYNLASPQVLEAIRQIKSCGQNVALHFAFTATPPADNAEIAQLVSNDFKLAQSIVGEIRSYFSWHNPSLFPGLMERCLDLRVPGLLNLNGRRFIRDIVYRSDSNWRFSLNQWHSIAREGHRQMQLLFHPFQWMARGRDMAEVLALTYAEVTRAAHGEFSINHVWKARDISKNAERVFASVANLFTVADDAVQ